MKRSARKWLWDTVICTLFLAGIAGGFLIGKLDEHKRIFDDERPVSAVLIRQCGTTQGIIASWIDKKPQWIPVSVQWPAYKIEYMAQFTRNGVMGIEMDCPPRHELSAKITQTEHPPT